MTTEIRRVEKGLAALAFAVLLQAPRPAESADRWARAASFVDDQSASTPPAGAAPTLRLVPLTGVALVLGTSDLERLPRQTVRVAYPAGTNHQTSLAEISGFPLRALLDRLGVPAGHDIRGDALQLYVVAEGVDGYRAVLALAELDPTFSDSPVLVADRRDGQPLAGTEGPLRLIVVGDKRPARWVRQLVRIGVHRAP
ncbi:MAG TPA: molybdopterin-dependent oxidoreductase [Thermoanaerobaculia bacterium]|nr:molybdopterin-dependent oxidoreductase [Thermoanaerobaculia bacterium]